MIFAYFHRFLNMIEIRNFSFDGDDMFSPLVSTSRLLAALNLNEFSHMKILGENNFE